MTRSHKGPKPRFTSEIQGPSTMSVDKSHPSMLVWEQADEGRDAGWRSSGMIFRLIHPKITRHSSTRAPSRIDSRTPKPLNHKPQQLLAHQACSSTRHLHKEPARVLRRTRANLTGEFGASRR